MLYRDLISIGSLAMSAICTLCCTVMWMEARTHNRKLQSVLQMADSDTDKSDIQQRLKRGAGSRAKKIKRRLYAGHYMSLATPAYINTTFPGYDDDGWYYSERMQGYISDTLDFEANSPGGVFKFFNDQNLVKKKSVFEPFKLKDNGQFVVLRPGLYLVYAQVLFNDKKEKQEVFLQHFSKKGKLVGRFLCARSFKSDTIVTFRSTCNVVVLINLTKRDYIVLAAEHSPVTVNVNGIATYLGAVLLS